MSEARYLHPTKSEISFGTINIDYGALCDGLPFSIPTVQRGPSLSFTYRDRLPDYKEVVFPKERFVTYEPSDAAWAVPLGIAKEVYRPIREGDEVDVELDTFKGRFQVTSIRLAETGQYTVEMESPAPSY